MKRRAFGAQGFRALGVGILAMGLVSLAWHDFVPGQPVPAHFPARAVLAVLADLLLILLGLLLLFRDTAARAAAAVAVYFSLIAALLMNVPVILVQPGIYGSYFGLAEQMAIGVAGLVLYADRAPLAANRAAMLARLGQILFGLCVLYFGGAHFVYLNLTVPLVPKFLPLSPLFWAYATGLCQIAAGLALLSGLCAPLAANLLTVLYAAFTPLVHLPQVLGHPTDRGVWAEGALNLALTGAAWVLADHLRASRRAG